MPQCFELVKFIFTVNFILGFRGWHTSWHAPQLCDGLKRQFRQPRVSPFERSAPPSLKRSTGQLQEAARAQGKPQQRHELSLQRIRHDAGETIENMQSHDRLLN
jgi:hypothetical protein